MANIKSAIKRNKQNEKKRIRNRIYRGTARTFVAKARTAINGKDVEAAKAATLQAISALDKAAEQGVIHRNNAARRKSRLVKAFAKMEPAKVETAMVEPVVEAEPKKATPRRRAAKAEAKIKSE